MRRTSQCGSEDKRQLPEVNLSIIYGCGAFAHWNFSKCCRLRTDRQLSLQGCRYTGSTIKPKFAISATTRRGCNYKAVLIFTFKTSSLLDCLLNCRNTSSSSNMGSYSNVNTIVRHNLLEQVLLSHILYSPGWNKAKWNQNMLGRTCSAEDDGISNCWYTGGSAFALLEFYLLVGLQYNIFIR